MRYAIAGWCGLAGGIASQSDWALWARHALKLQPTLPRPALESVPARLSRRLDTLGRCVMFASEQCLPRIKAEPAVISVSRHGDLPFLHNLIECVRQYEDISPTAFTYSVHNRFASLISMFANYHGVNAAYSSVRDGFPLALAEAVALLAAKSTRQVLVVAYEPEIPEAYREIIADAWLPHVAAFVLQAGEAGAPTYSLTRDRQPAPVAAEGGSCLPLIRALMNKSTQRDGFWAYEYQG